MTQHNTTQHGATAQAPTMQQVVESLNVTLLEAKRREGLGDTPQQRTDKRWRAYCGVHNRTNTVKTHGTHGGWRRPRLIGAQTQWQRRCMEAERAPDTPVQPRGTTRHHTVVLLWEERTRMAQAYVAEVVRTPHDTTIRIPAGRRRVTAEVGQPDIDTLPEELVRLALAHKAEIYTLRHIIA